MKVAFARFIFLPLILGLLIGCSSGAKSSTTSVSPRPSRTSNTVVTQTEPEAEKTLYQFAELVTAGNPEGAVELLTPALKGVYEFQDYAPIRNTPRMEIVELVDFTGEWRPDVSGLDQTKVVDTRVYYLKVRYKVLGLIQSNFIDGEVFHHKATVLKLKNGQWLISELSAIRPPRD